AVCRCWCQPAWDPSAVSRTEPGRPDPTNLSPGPTLSNLSLHVLSVASRLSQSDVASDLPPVPGQLLSTHHPDTSHCFALEDEGLHTIAASCPRLSRLYLCRCVRPTGEGTRRLVPRCSSLHIAKLEGSLQCLSTAAASLTLALCCQVLRAAGCLNARGREGLSDRGLEHLAESCAKLKCLDVGKCLLVSDATLEFLALNLQPEGLRHKSCESISGRGLQMSTCRILIMWENVNLHSIRRMCSCCITST
uniref:F-box and leucine-rich repeat protein 7 n=1 Tax=Myripristis murdjan TaxID=586833 RepID=A0A667Z007_9TELE